MVQHAAGAQQHDADSHGEAAGVLGRLDVGLPLPDSSRSAFERLTGASLPPVTVHPDSAEPARRGASALTVGGHIALAPGRFRPGSRDGDALMAHELTHVVQQSGGHPGSAVVQANGSRRDGFEGEADAVAASVGSGVARPLRISPVHAAGTTGTCADRCGPVQLQNADATDEQAEEALVDEQAADEPVAGGFRRPDRERPPRIAYEDMISFRNRWWSTDENQLREMFEGVITRADREGGTEHAAWLLNQFVIDGGRARGTAAFPVISAHAVGARRGDLVKNPYTFQREEQERQRNEDAVQRLYPQIATTATRVFGRLMAERDEMLGRFRTHVHDTLSTLLDQGKARIDAEIIRYGLERTTTVEYDEKPRGGWSRRTVHQFSMADEPATRGLAGAARDLLEKKKALDSAEWDQSLHDWTMALTAGGLLALVDEQSGGTLAAARAARNAEVARRREEYALLGAIHAQRYPVLGAFLDDKAALAAIASESSTRRATSAGALLWDRLDRVERTRADLRDGDIDLWRLDDVIGVAKRTGGVGSGSLYDRWIGERVQAEKDEHQIVDYVLSAIGIVLGLLAIPATGGASLALAAGSVGVGAVSLSRAVADYRLKRANSMADRAFAIAGDDPSTFWIALEVVGVVLDLGAAAAAFRAIRQPVRAAVNAGAGAAEEATEAAVRAAEAQRAGLGARVREAITRQRAAGGRGLTLAESAGAAGHEATAMRRAATEMSEQASHAVAAKPSRLGGHHYKITPSGEFIRCTTCAILRAQYAAELANNPLLHEEFRRLRKASQAALGNAAKEAEIAEQLARLGDQLQIVRLTAGRRSTRDTLFRIVEQHADRLDAEPVFKIRLQEAAELSRADPAISARLAAELEDDLVALSGGAVRRATATAGGGAAAAEDLARNTARGRATVGAVASAPETHHLATQFVQPRIAFADRARTIFEEAFGADRIRIGGKWKHPIHHPINLINDFAEHRMFPGWWNATGRYVFTGHHPGYHSWVARNLRSALDLPGASREQAFRAFVEMTDRLKRVVQKYPHVLQRGDAVLPEGLRNLPR